MQLRERERELVDTGIAVAVVSFDTAERARRYRRDLELPWPVLIDAERQLYRAYGMLAASFLDLWGPRSWLAYWREFRRGQRLQRPGADISQRGGDVLIDGHGIIRLHHVGRGPADRPAVDHLLARVR